MRIHGSTLGAIAWRNFAPGRFVEFVSCRPSRQCLGRRPSGPFSPADDDVPRLNLRRN
jgi:hypothetical protein